MTFLKLAFGEENMPSMTTASAVESIPEPALDKAPPASIIYLPPNPSPVTLFTMHGTFVTASNWDHKIEAISTNAPTQYVNDARWIFRPQVAGQWAIESVARHTYVLVCTGIHGQVLQNPMVNGWERFQILLLGDNDTIAIRSCHGTIVRAANRDRLTTDLWAAHPAEPARFRVLSSEGSLLPTPQFPFPRNRVALRHVTTNTVLGVQDEDRQIVTYAASSCRPRGSPGCYWSLVPNHRNEAFLFKNRNDAWLRVEVPENGQPMVTATSDRDKATEMWVILLDAPSKFALGVACVDVARSLYLSVRRAGTAEGKSASKFRVEVQTEIEVELESETFEFVVVG
ncbi:hypothetical protein GGF31_005829 [Allomyces arbusculus]|nr:hypothetical protein GGF31_005829 [Allomyces arbusculus]